MTIMIRKAQEIQNNRTDVFSIIRLYYSTFSVCTQLWIFLYEIRCVKCGIFKNFQTFIYLLINYHNVEMCVSAFHFYVLLLK